VTAIVSLRSDFRNFRRAGVAEKRSRTSTTVPAFTAVGFTACNARLIDGTGADPLELNKDIRNISGATLSCRHVTEGVQRLLKVYNAALRGAAG